MSSSHRKSNSVPRALHPSEIGTGADVVAAQSAAGSASLPEFEDLLTWFDQIQAELATVRAFVIAMMDKLRGAQIVGAPAREVTVTPLPVMITDKEAAEHLGVQVSTIKTWCRQQEFEGARSMGKAGWRIPLASVQGFQRPPRRKGRGAA